MVNAKDYQNGKIYTIRNHIDDDIYVGSTTQPLSKRMVWHRSTMKREKICNRKVYKHMNDLGIENFYIELYESYPCNSCEELTKREGQIIRDIGTLNMTIAGQNGKEYREANKEKISEQRKEFYRANKGQILEQRKEYYEANKGQIHEQKKCYRETNQDKIKEHMKAYYKDNKDTILQGKCKPYTCECGRTIQYGIKARHFRSKVHKDYMSSISSSSSSSSSSSKEEV